MADVSPSEKSLSTQRPHADLPPSGRLPCSMQLSDQLQDAQAMLAFFQHGIKQDISVDFSPEEQRGAWLVLEHAVGQIAAVRCVLIQGSGQTI